MKTIEGKLIATGLKVGIVASRFNEFITGKLLGGAEDSFVRHGGNADDLEVAWVPGAFEIPLIAQKMAASKKYDAVVCLGAVIRGSTPHFDMVANESVKGIAQAGLQNGITGQSTSTLDWPNILPAGLKEYIRRCEQHIEDYIANSRDQRIESERITDKMRTFEHDLWEF